MTNTQHGRKDINQHGSKLIIDIRILVRTAKTLVTKEQKEKQGGNDSRHEGKSNMFKPMMKYDFSKNNYVLSFVCVKVP